MDGGAVVRHFLYSESEVSFDITSLEPREIGLSFLKKAKCQFLLDNQEKKVFRGRSFTFQVPEGKHSVLLLLLEEQG